MSTEPDYSNLGLKDIKVERDGAVVTITMNREKYRNTFARGISKEINLVFDLADRDDRVRAVILTASPTAPAYCSGADINNGWDVLYSPESEKEGEHAHRDEGGLISIAIAKCRKITIAAINGNAVGVGVTAFQLPFDFRFAWADARLTFPFVGRGIVPEATSTYMLPRLIGHSRANSLLLTGETVTPTSPYIKDLYHKILPNRADVYPAAKAFAQDLAARTSVTSIAYTKALLAHPGDSMEENHLLDSRAIKLTSASKDGEEGVKAFKEKRETRFVDKLSETSSPWYPWWRTVDTQHRKAKL